MKVQLLLLLALVGLLCGFTCASPTSLPTDGPTVPTQTSAVLVSDTSEVDHVTGPPPSEPTAVAEEIVTKVFTDAATIHTADPTTLGVQWTTVVSTVGPVVERGATDAASTPTTYPPLTLEETPPPTKQTLDEVQTAGPTETHTNEEMTVERNTQEGLSSGQIVGIVIGSLLAVVIAVAVGIAVVRRMGKYSSAKNKKPGKKESVMVSALRKKLTKQQDRAKFWKI